MSAISHSFPVQFFARTAIRMLALIAFAVSSVSMNSASGFQAFCRRLGIVALLVWTVLAAPWAWADSDNQSNDNRHDGSARCQLAKEGEDHEQGKLPYYLEQLPLDRQLRIAAEVGCVQRVRETLAQGARVDAVYARKTVLSQAIFGTIWAENGGDPQPEVIRLLLSHGADPNRHINTDISVHNPLYGALSRYQFSRPEKHESRRRVIELLLDFGARLPGNAARGEYKDALRLAGSHCDVELVERLLHTGMDFSLEGHDGPPILVGCGKPEMVRLMLDNGGVITPGAIEWVLSGVNKPWKAEIAHWLLDEGVDPAEHEFVRHALSWRDQRLLSRALEGGSSADHFVDPISNVPLVYATLDNNPDAVKKLLDYEANKNQTWRGKTAAEWARERGHEEIAQLIEQHADVESAQ